MANQIQAQRPSFSVAINSAKFQQAINNTLRDPERARRFTASIVSAVSINPDLQECDASTIVTAALLGESLNLPPSPQLGRYYLVPFNDNKRGRKVAQFQLGYKGYVELAMRSGYYKKMNVVAIKAGELIRWDALNEEIEVNLIDDDDEREKAPTIGYYAMFEAKDGFRKCLYWSRAKMESHAEQYSQGYKARKGYTFWEKNFDDMAKKTMLRQLISKWGRMSIEMQEAYPKDMAVLGEDGSVDYVETEDKPVIIPQGEPEDVPQMPAEATQANTAPKDGAVSLADL